MSDQAEIHNAEVPDAGTNGGITSGNSLGNDEAWSQQGLVVRHMPTDVIPPIVPLPNTAKQDRTSLMPIEQVRRRRGSSPSRGMAAFKEFVATIRSPPRSKHRKTRSASFLHSAASGNTAGTLKSRKSMSILVEPDSRFDFGHHIFQARMKFEATKIGFGITGHEDYEPRLADKLAEASEQEHFTNHDFIPNERLNELVTQKSVEQELSHFEYLPSYLRHRFWRKTQPRIVATSPCHDTTPQPSTALSGSMTRATTEKNFQRIFTILVLIRLPQKIWAFVKEGVHDGDLPLRSVQAENADEPLLGRCGEGKHTALRCLKARRDVRDFLKHQWCVLAPSFKQSEVAVVPPLQTVTERILPFVRWENKSRRGGYGVVHQVEIHKDHHNFSEKEVPQNVVAVKEIANADKDTFKREYNILCHLRRMEHANEHIVTLLAAYERNERFYLILPWADQDLRRYWQEKDPTALSNECRDVPLSVWILQQCLGLVGAVHTIHHYLTTSGTAIYRDGYSGQPRRQIQEHTHDVVYGPRGPLFLNGRHGDIKPANILWYPIEGGRGILRLADFGTAHFSSTKEVSLRDGDIIPSSRPYQSPESIYSHQTISGQCDVWALGCVFLEFVSWYAGGRDLLEKFEQGRKDRHESASFCLDSNPSEAQPRIELKRAVSEMIGYLLQAEKIQNRPCMSSFVQIIRDDMLVIPHGEVRRKSSGTIFQDLGSVVEARSE